MNMSRLYSLQIAICKICIHTKNEHKKSFWTKILGSPMSNLQIPAIHLIDYPILQNYSFIRDIYDLWLVKN